MTSSTTWRRRIAMMSSQTIGIPKSSIPTAAAIMSAVAVAAAYVVTTPSPSSTTTPSPSSTTTFCDAAVNTTKQQQEVKHDHHPHAQHSPYQFGTIKKDDDAKSLSTTNNELYYGYFPKRQLFQPKLEYPLWDSNWDGREIVSSDDDGEHRKMMRTIRKNGVTRHILLVRHGQYNETSRHDVERTLTPLGIQQAHLTGQRLASLMKQYNTTNTDNNSDTILPCNIVSIRVSQLQRAKETADIIASYLPASVTYYQDGDGNLNEGRPCHTIPSGGPVPAKLIEVTDVQHQRIEHAYQEYFYRKNYIMDTTSTSSNNNDNQSNVLLLRSSSEETTSNTVETNHNDSSAITTTTANDATPTMIGDEKHEFEIIVCHANVIRYFLCRALQLPPEVWLRYCPFNCSLTYLTIRPTGSVSCRMLGDIGHLPYDACTFSQHHGFNW